MAKKVISFHHSHPVNEPWLRGSIPDIPAILQPVAHAITQAKEDVEAITKGFNDALLWIKPAGRASVGFHLQHISGVLDRMLTYVNENELNEKQMDELSDEGLPFKDIKIAFLVDRFNCQVNIFLEHLKNIDESSLTQKRMVGRKKLPSTVIGLLFHAAEHTQRHAGQLLVTVAVVNDLYRDEKLNDLGKVETKGS